MISEMCVSFSISRLLNGVHKVLCYGCSDDCSTLVTKVISFLHVVDLL